MTTEARKSKHFLNVVAAWREMQMTKWDLIRHTPDTFWEEYVHASDRAILSFLAWIAIAAAALLASAIVLAALTP